MVTLVKWTVEDYHCLIEAGILSDRQVELLAGEIIEMSPEGPIHTIYGEGLADYLRLCLRGRAWIREARPVTFPDSELEPDIAVVKPPRLRYREHHPYPEDIFWLIEVSDSTLVKDLNQKKRVYAQAGIPEYWVIEVKAQQMVVFRQPQGETYLSKQKLKQGIVVPLAFPDVEVSIEKLWQGELS